MSNNFRFLNNIIQVDQLTCKIAAAAAVSSSSLLPMGFGKFFYTIVITCSALLMIYGIVISSNVPLKQDFPGPLDTSSSSTPINLLIKMPLGTSSSSTPKNLLIKMPTDSPSTSSSSKKSKRLFHTAVTSSDSIYNTWQCRVMYYWFKKQKNKPGSEMGGFTRILHSGKSDKFMDEIPTFVAQPLPAGMDQGYIVLNRPWAFVQWLQQTEIEEDYILMSEPDHILVKPIPNLSKPGRGAAFPFFYIKPNEHETTLRKFFPETMGPITKIDPIGNSPVIVGKLPLKMIAPTWMNISLAMRKDPETYEAFGWILEMYAYAVASALHGVDNILHKEFMIQPPWDKETGEAYIIHYTYGCDYDLQGNLTYGRIGEWRFDKRTFLNVWPPRNLPMPPHGVPESVVTLVKMVNEATANLPNWGS